MVQVWLCRGQGVMLCPPPQAGSMGCQQVRSHSIPRGVVSGSPRDAGGLLLAMLCSGRICGANPPLGAGEVTRCALAAGGFCPRGTPGLWDGSCLVWHVGCKAGLALAAIAAAGCRGALWGAMGCCEPAQCRGHYTAPLPQLSWPVGVWGGSLQLECPLEGTGIKPKPRGASDTRGTEQDMATKPAGPVQGRRGLRFLSPAFSVAQQFGMGTGRGTGKGGSP